MYMSFYISSLLIIETFRRCNLNLRRFSICLRIIHNLILGTKLQTHTIHTVSLVRRRRVPFSLKHMPQMPSALRTHNLRPAHPEAAIRMPLHRSGDGVKERRPPAPALKLMRGPVKRRVAGRACVDALGRHVLVEFTRVGRLGAFFADDAELFGTEDRAPFIVGLLDWVGHVSGRGGAEEGA